MLRDGSLGHAKPTRQRPDTQIPLPKKCEDGKPCLNGQDPQRLGYLRDSIALMVLAIHIRSN